MYRISCGTYTVSVPTYVLGINISTYICTWAGCLVVMPNSSNSIHRRQFPKARPSSALPCQPVPYVHTQVGRPNVKRWSPAAVSEISRADLRPPTVVRYTLLHKSPRTHPPRSISRVTPSFFLFPLVFLFPNFRIRYHLVDCFPEPDVRSAPWLPLPECTSQISARECYSGCNIHRDFPKGPFPFPEQRPHPCRPPHCIIEWRSRVTVTVPVSTRTRAGPDGLVHSSVGLDKSVLVLPRAQAFHQAPKHCDLLPGDCGLGETVCSISGLK